LSHIGPACKCELGQTVPNEILPPSGRADKLRLGKIQSHTNTPLLPHGGVTAALTPRRGKGRHMVRHLFPDGIPLWAQSGGEHLVHRFHRHEPQGSPDGLVDLLQIPDVVLGNQHRGDAAAEGGHGLLLQSADGQHPAPQRDFAGHGNARLDLPVRQGREHGSGDGDAGGGAVLGHCALWEVDVDVLRLVKVRWNPQHRRPAPQAAESRLSRLLHHVSQVAGELQLAGAVHDVDLHLQDLAARLSPGQAVHHADLLPVRVEIRGIGLAVQELGELLLCHGNPLDSALQQAHIRLPADGSQPPLQQAHTGFP
ncbi:Flp pilus assembly protein TadB, partial [Dysosmobacter welbionis]